MRRSRRTHLRLALATLVVLLLPAAAAAQSYRAVVETVTGDRAEGLLLEITAEGVRLDPDGPVSLRVVRSADIRTVYVTELDRSFTFPLDEALLPADLRRPRVRTTRATDFGRFHVALSVGRVTVDLGEEDYYSGFGSGTTLHLSGRYFFADAPRASRIFAFASFYQSTPGVSDDVEDFGGLASALDLRVRHYAVGPGLTTRMSRGGNYGYLLAGLVWLENHVDVPAQGVAVAVEDSKLGFRFEVGGVIGLAPRWGLELSTGFDFIYAGQTENTGTFDPNDTMPDADGMLLHAAVGAVYSF